MAVVRRLQGVQHTGPCKRQHDEAERDVARHEGHVAAGGDELHEEDDRVAGTGAI